jgi:signal transduction histidine kinase
VVCAIDGQAALEAAIASKPDLILSDVMMPGLDGFGLLQAVRSDDRLRQTPVILISARAGEDARIEGLNRGADDYLIKPFTARELLARVDGQIALATLRSESEARYRSVADNLDRIVSERTAELRSTNEQLEAYVYSIAHDLRAPLRAMTSFGQILVEEHAAEVSEPAREMLRRIRASGEFMDRLLLDLLAYGRAARAEMELRIVNVKETWEVARFQCATDIERTGSAIDEGTLAGKVVAHGAMLGQCFANLLSNAMKFVAPGVKPVVRVWSEEAANHVRIWVADNGIGISGKHQEKAFRVFERLNGNQYPGTGIGLSIVRKGVERMGGRVGVESELGKGSRFWIELKKAETIAVPE